MLSVPLREAMQMLGDEFMAPAMEQEVMSVVGRGDYYHWAGGAGSLSQAWTTHCGRWDMEFGYDSSKLVHDARIGKHITPAGQYDENTGLKAWHAEKVDDMASLIDLGLGGMFFGNGNPTQTPTHFWDSFLDTWDSKKRTWVIECLDAVGLPVVYRGFV